MDNAPFLMEIPVHFFSHFRELAGCPSTTEPVREGATLNQLLDQLYLRFPRLRPLRSSTLTAVGLDYQTKDYRLKPGDEVSLFPPVSGG